MAFTTVRVDPQQEQKFSMSQDTFNCCFLEWEKAESFFFHRVAQTFDCPCCGASPHAVHFDGNIKLYKYKAAGRQVSLR
ncbi:hypothetical protein EB796_006703 [Bugula neritina]|uniref:Uncharacterized protein n=1 Tax=Bugula neritina TaxID=10212 RepID=A0A7J7KAL5_BUGNE|nr:hypothetical protein EB796_006703 [Bugula neritina]